MPARNYKAEFGLAIKIYSVWILMLNNSPIWPVNTKPQNINALPNFTRKNLQPMWLYNENES